MSKSAFYASKEVIRLAHDNLFRENEELKKLLWRWIHFIDCNNCVSCDILFDQTMTKLEGEKKLENISSPQL